MIDIKLLRENSEQMKTALKKKHVDVSQIDALLSLDKEKRNLSQQLEELLNKRNHHSKEMAGLTPEQRKERMGEVTYIKEQIAELEPKIKHLEEEINNLLAVIPNPPLPSVPEGNDASENAVVRTVGKKPAFNFDPLDHIQIARKKDLLELEAASRMSGSRFYYLKNEAVLWEFALAQFVIRKLVKKGFTPIIPPVLVKENAMFSTGFFPADRNEIYHVNPEDDNLFLVGTSEVPLCMLHAGEVLPVEKLPLRYVGFSTCFRREAGSYGKDMHGILRVHQFEKLEMFSFCHPDKSEQEHEFLLSIEEEIMQELGLHYQVVNICGGDLGAPAAKKYDIETWIPSQKKFRELTSCSNCTDYQARRANIRFKEGKVNRHVYTLNGTACAMTRMLIALMENYQEADGSVRLPEALAEYL